MPLFGKIVFVIKDGILAVMRNLLLSRLLLTAYNLNGQFNEDNFDPMLIKTKSIPIAQKNDIVIVDRRLTALSGTRNSEFHDFYKVKIKSIDEVKKFFLSHFSISSADSAYTVLCVIKKIVLSNNIYLPEDGKAENVKNKFFIKTGGTVKLEFFAAIDDVFIPLYRFDSTITGTFQISVRTAPDYLSDLLTSSLTRLETIPWNTIRMKGKRNGRIMIDSSVNKSFDLFI